MGGCDADIATDDEVSRATDRWNEWARTKEKEVGKQDAKEISSSVREDWKHFLCIG
jgi:hypothetical protein